MRHILGLVVDVEFNKNLPFLKGKHVENRFLAIRNG